MQSIPLLSIKDLRVNVADREILTGINLVVNAGEVHAIMGPNGSGKSTLAHVLAGREGYTITAGSVTFRDQDLLAMAPEERARAGLFLGFQYPVEVPGVSNVYLLRAALNARRKARGEAEIDAAIGGWCAARTAVDVLAVMDDKRVPAGPIYNVADMFADPHFRARGLFERVEIDGKPLEIPALMPRLQGTPGATEWPGPAVGSHTDAVLGEVLGMGEQEIAALRADGAV